VTVVADGFRWLLACAQRKVMMASAPLADGGGLEGGDVAGRCPVPNRAAVLVQLVLGEEHGHLDLAGAGAAVLALALAPGGLRRGHGDAGAVGDDAELVRQRLRGMSNLQVTKIIFTMTPIRRHLSGCAWCPRWPAPERIARLRGADEACSGSGCNTYNQEKPATCRDASGPTYLSHTPDQSKACGHGHDDFHACSPLWLRPSWIHDPTRGKPILQELYCRFFTLARFQDASLSLQPPDSQMPRRPNDYTLQCPLLGLTEQHSLEQRRIANA
jgi:hypothetical protein